jgi:hypothetical protein
MLKLMQHLVAALQKQALDLQQIAYLRCCSNIAAVAHVAFVTG